MTLTKPKTQIPMALLRPPEHDELSFPSLQASAGQDEWGPTCRGVLRTFENHHALRFDHANRSTAFSKVKKHICFCGKVGSTNGNSDLENIKTSTPQQAMLKNRSPDEIIDHWQVVEHSLLSDSSRNSPTTRSRSSSSSLDMAH